MALTGTVRLNHGGKDYAMTINFAALCIFEEVTGKNGFAMLRMLSGGGIQAGLVGARDLRAMVYGGLMVHQPDMTLDLVGEIIDANPEALFQAVSASMPDAADSPDSPPEKPKRRRSPTRK